MTASIYSRDGKWYWADESWAENGPCETRGDAAFAQDMYVSGALEGEPPPGDPADRERCMRLGINLEAWDRLRPEPVVEIEVEVCLVPWQIGCNCSHCCLPIADDVFVTVAKPFVGSVPYNDDVYHFECWKAVGCPPGEKICRGVPSESWQSRPCP